MNYIYYIVGGWLAFISFVSIVVTIADKIKSKMSGVRAPESGLLILSALGGSVAMLLTMLVIRHKTKHAKFMIGIPLIILLQVAAAVIIFKLTA